MKLSRDSRGSAVPLLHWLLVIGGLGLIALVRSDNPTELTGVALGALCGTALGHALAAARARLRLVLIGIVVMSLPLSVFNGIAACALGFGGGDPVGESMMAFVPATLCAYASLSESGGLVGFWFPVALWTVGLLDGAGGSGALPARAWLLLGVLAMLFVATLRARETRRIALWRRHAPVRLAAAPGDVVLREAPFRTWGSLGFSMIVGSLALLLTAWIAPLLWGLETGHDAVADAITAPVAPGGLAPAVPCCPSRPNPAESQRVKEYFDLRAAPASATPSGACRPCGSTPTGAVAERPSAVYQAGVAGQPTEALGPTDPVWSPGGSPADPSNPSAPSPTPAAAGRQEPSAPPAPTPPDAPAPPHAKPVAAYAATTAPRAAETSSPGFSTQADSDPAEVRPAAPAMARAGWAWRLGSLLRLLFTLLVIVPLVHVVLRPLRRLVVLRHLQRPLWPESADQRVSNLWHLMLVGLKDAGFRTHDHEQPQELAARVGFEKMRACATVLDRARHGARLAAEDLDEMSVAARDVYDAARKRLPWVIRAGSALRWPLV
jgi:hypothetical protein